MKLPGIFHLKEHPSMRKLGRFAAYTALAPKRALSHNRQCCNFLYNKKLKPFHHESDLSLILWWSIADSNR